MKINSKEITLKNGKLITLRSPSSFDAENMLNHLRTTHSESYKNLNQSVDFWNNFSVAEEQKVLADFETSKSKFMIVAVLENTIVGGLGFVGYQAEFVRHSGQIGMSVQKAYASSGIGTALMEYTKELAKEFGFHRIDLTVRTYNSPGIALYEKVDFKRIGLLKDAAFIDGKYVDEYSYQLILG